MNPFIDRSQKNKDLCMTLGINEGFLARHKKDNPITKIVDEVEQLTYHNYAHMEAVTLQAFEIAEKNYNFSLMQKHILFLACMFHDYGHRQSKGPDIDNINKAMDSLDEIAKSTLFKEQYFNRILMLAGETIKVTEYPFVYLPFNDIERIIRDADLTMMVQLDGGYFLKGLCNELELKPENGKQAVEEHKKFLASCEFYTPAGKKLYKKWYEGGSPMSTDHWEWVEAQFDEASQ